jgi:MinD superfamily P-loop ATPase
MELMPTFDETKCTAAECGYLCVSVCKCGAIVLVQNRVTIIESKLCGWCTQCEAICPTGAISCPFEIVVE